MKRLILFIAILLAAAPAFAQSLPCTTGTVTNTLGQAVPGATVIVLKGTLTGSQAVNVSTSPGSPLASIFVDPYGSTAINQVTSPLLASGQGNYAFCAAAGWYVIQIYGQGVQVQLTQQITLSAVTGGGTSGTGLGNGTNVIDATTVFGCPTSGFSTCVTNAFASCTISPCTVDARGFGNAPTMTGNITCPASDKLILPGATITNTGGYQIITNTGCTLQGQGRSVTNINDSTGHPQAVVLPPPGGASDVTVRDLEITNNSSVAGSICVQVGVNGGPDSVSDEFSNLTLICNIPVAAYGGYYNHFDYIAALGVAYGLDNLGPGSGAWAGNWFNGGSWWASGVGGKAIYENGGENNFIAPDVEYGTMEFGTASNGDTLLGGYTSANLTFDNGANNDVLWSTFLSCTNNASFSNRCYNGVVPTQQATISFFCTGTVPSATTIYLFGAGARTSVCSTATFNFNQLIPSSAVQNKALNLQVAAGTAGINASSGVVTFLGSGGATLLTCTLGTGTTCQDITHVAGPGLGSGFSISVTTQSGDTLGNISGTVTFE